MEKLLIGIIYMSITAGYCALIVMALRFLIRRLPKIYSYGLWLAVFLRFVCPVFPESNYSLVRFEPQKIWQDISYSAETAESGIRAEETGKAGEMLFPEASAQNSNEESVKDGNLQAGNVWTEDSMIKNDGGQKIKWTKWTDILGIVWLAGVVALTFYSIGSVFQLKKQLAAAEHQEKNIYVADNLRTPFVLGVFKPCIFLPAALCKREREVVLAHEKIHIMRKDHLIKRAAFFIASVHWFNPLAWVSYYLMCKDMEMSCDENVIEKMGQEVKKEYSASLLSLASGRRMDSVRMTAFGEGNVKKRIVRVLDYKRPSMKAVVLGSVILVTATVGLLFNSVKVLARQNEVWNFIPDTENVGAGLSIQNPSEKSRELMEAAGEMFAGETAEYREPILHFYVPEFYIESGYTDLERMPEEEYSYLARKALYELYETTGTKIEECYYFYTDLGDFNFGLTPEDLEHSRIFYSRSFGSDEREEFVAVPAMYIANARSVWYSPVYQYKLPLGFETMSDEERAIWFVKNSSLYNGQAVTGCSRPYSAVQSTWRLYTADGAAYEIDLDNQTDSFGNLTGPYADGDIRH